MTWHLLMRTLILSLATTVALTGSAADRHLVSNGEARGAPKPHAWRGAPPLRWEASTVVTLGPLEIKTFLLTLK